MKKSLIAITIFCFLAQYSYAYFEKYPPHKFKEEPYDHLKVEPVVSYGSSLANEFTTTDGMVEVRMRGYKEGVYFVIRDEKNVLMEDKDINGTIPRPWDVYWMDLDGNGFKDFIVISHYMGNGLAAYNDRVDIFLKKKSGDYSRISYDSMMAEIRDFTDINGDGRYETIITGFYYGKNHNYFTYSIYDISVDGLVNADKNYEEFPKFIWFTNDPNDKNTTHLTLKEKKEHIEKKDSSVQYSMVNGSVAEEPDRLEHITDRLLYEDLDNKTRASLLVEKAKIQIGVGPRTPTALLINAIKLDPDNGEYKALLREWYDTYWKDMDMNKDNYEAPGMYEDFAGIKKAAEEILKR